jgi:hypothetical protein
LIGGSGTGAVIIEDAFHKVRRSLTLDDIETYTEHRAEGYNGSVEKLCSNKLPKEEEINVRTNSTNRGKHSRTFCTCTQSAV